MPIIVSCWSCGSKLRAPDDWAGRRVKCPRCERELTVPVPGESGDPAPPDAVQAAPPPLAQVLAPGAYPPGSGGPDLQYLRAYQYIFDNPNWITNLILGSLASIIPAIGGLLVMGYCFDAVEDLHKNGGQRYPDFDFNRFVGYLLRGLWPFVFVLCIAVPLSLVIVVMVSLAIAVVGPKGGMAIAGLLYVALIALQMMILAPALIFAGLRQELDFVGAYHFVRDFLQRAWRELLLAELFLMFSGTLVLMAGMLMCCVGVVPASVILYLARAHMFYQLYDLYLQRGGSPIPLKPPAA